MDTQTRFDLIMRGLEEALTADDLRLHLETGVPLKHYIGYEISGKIHIGSGLQAAKKINDYQKAGMDCSIYLASWHAWINNKFGGDLEKIRNVGCAYFKEGMKASLKCMGADDEKIKFVTGDELYHHNDEYWLQVIEIAKMSTVNRIKRATTIMGRNMEDEMPLAFLLYPPMQVADIFVQDLTIAHAGMDQRKAQVIAREVAEKIKVHPLKHDGKIIKPIALHHPLIAGLTKPGVWPIQPDKMRELLSEMKMSKSNPNSAVFITDSEQEITSKINKAFCLEKEVHYNPVLNWLRHLVFIDEKSSFTLERPEKFGGTMTYDKFHDLERDFREGKVHPGDLKANAAQTIIKLLEPARKHFTQPAVQRLKAEMDAMTITK